jgi:SAM-dependent methyltransferase
MDGFDRIANTYDRYRLALEDARRWVLTDAGLSCGHGRSAVDLGTGTGAMASALRACEYRTVGIDSSRGMLAQALARSDTAGATFLHAPASRTGLPSDVWDLVTVSQSWHLFDPHLVTSEVCRLLAPGGGLLIATFDWLPAPGSIAQRSEAIIRDLDAEWTGHDGDGRHHSLHGQLRSAGLCRQRTGERVFHVAYSTQEWLGRLATSSAVGAHADGELAQRMLDRLVEEFADVSGRHIVEYRAWWVLAQHAESSSRLTS